MCPEVGFILENVVSEFQHIHTCKFVILTAPPACNVAGVGVLQVGGITSDREGDVCQVFTCEVSFVVSFRWMSLFQWY